LLKIISLNNWSHLSFCKYSWTLLKSSCWSQRCCLWFMPYTLLHFRVFLSHNVNALCRTWMETSWFYFYIVWLGRFLISFLYVLGIYLIKVDSTRILRDLINDNFIHNRFQIINWKILSFNCIFCNWFIILYFIRRLTKTSKSICFIKVLLILINWYKFWFFLITQCRHWSWCHWF
jgi:hypothetical protein